LRHDARRHRRAGVSEAHAPGSARPESVPNFARR
jgi:hypothetical protein